jgi:hypothetical protein
MSIDVMKQALEALEEINKLSVGENAICLPAEIDGAMDALRAAIEQAQRNEFNPDWDAMAVMVEEQQRMAKRIEELEAQALRAALQAPMHYYRGDEQGNLKRNDIHVEQEPVCDKDPRGCWSVRCQLGKVCKNTAPRQWQGLTDEEIDTLFEAHHNQYGECEVAGHGYERAIEAKLKEKNA